MSDSSWTITTTIPSMAVPELDVGIEFYERLGFELDWRWPADDSTHAGLHRGEEAGRLADRDDCPPAQALGPPDPPAPTDYDLKDFSIVDPWGHHMSFGQPLLLTSEDACDEDDS